MDSPQKKEQDKKKLLETYGRFSALGIQMAVLILGGTWIGNWADGRFNIQIPIFTLVGALLGLTLSMIVLFTAFKK